MTLDKSRKVQFDITPRESLICSLCLMKYNLGGVILWCTMFGVFVGTVNHNPNSGIVSGFVWALAMLVIGPIIYTVTSIVNFKNDDSFKIGCIVTVSPEKFSSRAPSKDIENIYGWKSIVKIEQSAKCILVHVSKYPVYAVCIPRRGFQSEADADAFLNDALSYWKHAHGK